MFGFLFFLVWVVLVSPVQESQNNICFVLFFLVWAFWHPDFGVFDFFWVLETCKRRSWGGWRAYVREAEKALDEMNFSTEMLNGTACSKAATKCLLFGPGVCTVQGWREVRRPSLQEIPLLLDLAVNKGPIYRFSTSRCTKGDLLSLALEASDLATIGAAGAVAAGAAACTTLRRLEKHGTKISTPHQDGLLYPITPKKALFRVDYGD